MTGEPERTAGSIGLPVVRLRSGSTDERLPWGTALGAATVIALARPRMWLVSLAGFLARGGLVILLLPVVVLPTPSGVANAVGGPVSSLIFGAPSPTLVAMVLGLVVTAVVALVGGNLAGGWAERAGIAAALEGGVDEGYVTAPAGGLALHGTTRRVAALRLLGLVPLGAALVAATPVVYAATYRELILPEQLRDPLALRVLRDVPGTLLAVGGVWLLSDAATAIGVRRLVLEGRSVPRAWLAGWAGIVRRPIRVSATALVSAAVLVLLVLPAVAASYVGWHRVRLALAEGTDPAAIASSVVLFVLAWLGGLVLAGLATAFRTALFTFEVARRAPGRSSHSP